MTEPKYGDYCRFCLRNPCRCIQNFNELPKGDLDELMKNFENKKPMTKKDEFIANWQPEFGADQHIFKEHLTTIIQSECTTRDELIKEYEQYIKLLGEELDEVTTMVSVHGWKSKRVEAGLICRDRISNLKAKI